MSRVVLYSSSSCGGSSSGSYDSAYTACTPIGLGASRSQSCVISSAAYAAPTPPAGALVQQVWFTAGSSSCPPPATAPYSISVTAGATCISSGSGANITSSIYTCNGASYSAAAYRSPDCSGPAAATASNATGCSASGGGATSGFIQAFACASGAAASPLPTATSTLTASPSRAVPLPSASRTATASPSAALSAGASPSPTPSRLPVYVAPSPPALPTNANFASVGSVTLSGFSVTALGNTSAVAALSAGASAAVASLRSAAAGSSGGAPASVVITCAFDVASGALIYGSAACGGARAAAVGSGVSLTFTVYSTSAAANAEVGAALASPAFGALLAGAAAAINPADFSGLTADSTPPAPAPVPAASSSNVGAIVGGVLGGLAALGIVAAALYITLASQRRAGVPLSRKSGAASSAAVSINPMTLAKSSSAV